MRSKFPQARSEDRSREGEGFLVTLADLRICSWCEEAHPFDKYQWVAGYWVKPYEDIDWEWGQGSVVVFVQEMPERTGAWLCPNGCLAKSEPERVDEEDSHE